MKVLSSTLARTIMIACFLCGLAILVRVQPTRAETGAPIAIEPDGYFEVSAPGPNLVGVAASGEKLFFLLVNRTTAAVVQTDSSGGQQVYLPIPPSPIAHDARAIRVTPEGGLVILEKVSGGCHLLFLGNNGVIAKDVPLSTFVGDIEFVGGQLVGLDEAASRVLREPEKTVYASLSPAIDWPSMLIRQPGEILAVLELGDARLRTVGAIPLATRMLEAPEIQGLLRTSPTRTKVSLIIETAASSPQGDIYCSISPYMPEKGAILLRFDNGGKLQGRYRPVLPAFNDLKARGNPGGYIATSAMAANRDRLYIASSLGNRCAYYPLPK